MGLGLGDSGLMGGMEEWGVCWADGVVAVVFYL